MLSRLSVHLSDALNNEKVTLVQICRKNSFDGMMDDCAEGLDADFV